MFYNFWARNNTRQVDIPLKSINQTSKSILDINQMFHFFPLLLFCRFQTQFTIMTQNCLNLNTCNQYYNIYFLRYRFIILTKLVKTRLK